LLTEVDGHQRPAASMRYQIEIVILLFAELIVYQVLGTYTPSEENSEN
jgi:hypothetical protein